MIAVRQFGAADGVEHNPYSNTALGCGDQMLSKSLAQIIIVNDIKLDQDIGLGSINSGKYGLECRGPIHKQCHAVAEYSRRVRVYDLLCRWPYQILLPVSRRLDNQVWLQVHHGERCERLPEIIRQTCTEMGVQVSRALCRRIRYISLCRSHRI